MLTSLIQRILYATIFSLLFSCNSTPSITEQPELEPTEKKENSFQVIAYYTPSTAPIDRQTVHQLDQIIFSFLHLKGNKLTVEDPGDNASLTYLTSLKKENPDLKVLLSLGGWGGCETCSDVFSTEEGRKEFAQSVADLLLQYNADGIDLDWEYPVVPGYPGHPHKPEDRENFTFLVKELRQTLGDEPLITFAAGGFDKFLEEAIEWKEVIPLLDGVNLMSYDLVSGNSIRTGHHTPLYSTNEQSVSADNAIKYLISIGVPSEKIIIGAAFYARVWENVPNVSNGLYQEGKFQQFIHFRDLDEYFNDNPGFNHHWDVEANATYSYNPDLQLFVTYDDPLSIEQKTLYVKENNLGGIMFWQLSGDKTDNGLLDVIDSVKNN